METTNTSFSSAGQPAPKAKNRSTRANGNTSTWSQPTREQIAKLACQLYIQSGCQEGRDAENWLRAEQILREQSTGQAASAQPQPARKPSEENKQRSYRERF